MGRWAGEEGRRAGWHLQERLESNVGAVKIMRCRELDSMLDYRTELLLKVTEQSDKRS